MNQSKSSYLVVCFTAKADFTETLIQTNVNEPKQRDANCTGFCCSRCHLSSLIFNASSSARIGNDESLLGSLSFALTERRSLERPRGKFIRLT